MTLFEMSYDWHKVVLIGETGVGKTCIFSILQNRPFNAHHSPTVSGLPAPLDVTFPDNSTGKIMIWDTAGQERYRKIIPMYYNRASVVIAVYAISDKHSFEAIEPWIREVRAKAPEDCAIILVGNKCDLADERVISPEEGLDLQTRLNAVGFRETSAQIGTGIQELLSEVIEAAVKPNQAEFEMCERPVDLHEQKKEKQKESSGKPDSNCC
jgi:small GTP-binding protein